MNVQNLEVINSIRSALINNGTVDCFKESVIKMAENLPELKGMIESTQTMLISSLHDEIEKTLKGKDYADSSLHGQVRASAFLEIEKTGGLGNWNPPKPMSIPAELYPLVQAGFNFEKAEIKGRFKVTHANWLDGVADYDDQQFIADKLRNSGYLVIWTNLQAIDLFHYEKDSGDYLPRVVKLPSVAEIYKAR